MAGLSVEALLDNLKDGAVADMMIDLNDYFDGGAEPYNFNLKAVPAEDHFATAKVDENMLTLKLALPDGGFEFSHYRDGRFVTVVAVDANGAVAENTVTVKPNRAPNPTDEVTINLGVVDQTDPLTLGTQDGDSERDDGDFYDCDKFNVCVITLFQDDGDDEDDVTRSVTEPATSSNFSWDRNDDGMIVLTGLSTTWVADTDAEQTGNQPGHKLITVKIKAEDSGGLSREATFMLRVNAQPTVSEGAAAVVRTLEVEGVGEMSTGYPDWRS